MIEFGDRLQEAIYRYVEVLTVEIGPRAPFEGDGLQRAKRYIQSELLSAGFQVTEQRYKYKDREVANIVAELPSPVPQANYFLVGAHYDTLPTTPGADDNASAVAVMLELAKRWAQKDRPRSLKFVAFTLEESPAFMTKSQGSRVFVKNRLEAGDKIEGALILEMVGYTAPVQRYPFALRWAGYPEEGNFIGIVANRRSRKFSRSIQSSFALNENLPMESLTVPFDGWILPATRLSDHASFWDARVPAIMITDTAFFRNNNYHTPYDTIDTLDYRFMSELVKSLEYAVIGLI